MSNKKKKSFNFGLLIFIAIGAACGFYGASVIDYLSGGFSESNIPFPVVLVFLIAVFYVSFLLSVLIHEAGHLVLGLLTGYDFVSFRIGSITFVKENGKIARRKFNIVGTGGQCILSHKIVENPADIPYFWYHFGGAFFNFLTAIICAPLFLIPKNIFVVVGFGIFSALSFVIGIMNILPSKAMGMGTDGYNILQMKKSEANRVAIYKTMAINALQYQGVKLDEMDSSLVTFSGEEKHCTFGTALEILEATLLMYRHDFKAAAEIFQLVLDDENAYKIYQNESKCELMFCMIMNGSTKEEIENFYDKELKKYVKATEKYYIGRKRLLYAYYLVAQKDSEKANRELEFAEKMESTYPGKGEYLSEIDLIGFVGEKFSN